MVGKVNFGLAPLLVDLEIIVLSSDIDVSQTKFYDECSNIRWQIINWLRASLLPSKLWVEFDTGKSC